MLILPWNIASEVTAQLSEVQRWGGQFAVAVPRIRFLHDERQPPKADLADRPRFDMTELSPAAPA